MAQKKHILTVNVLLVAISVGLGWKLIAEWRGASNRQLVTTGTAADAAIFNLPAEPAPSTAGSEVVAANPFSQDRNSIVSAPAAAPAAPPPPLPVVIGTMKLGAAYEALMAESAQNASTAFKQVKAGATVGGYKVAEIRDDEVIVEYNGERTTINVYLSASGVARSAGRTTVAEATPAPAAPRVETSSAPASSANSQSVAAPAAAPVQLPSPDPLLKITIEGNRRRYERTTMFGPQIWYEDIK